MIEYVKAIKKYPQFSTIDSYGLIDRDFRNEQEIENLKEYNIFTLEVAEVENLFLVPEILQVASERYATIDQNPEDLKQQAESFIREKFKQDINSQVSSALVSEIKYQLSSLDISSRNANTYSITNKIYESFTKEKLKALEEEKMTLFNNAQDTSIKGILKIYNSKALLRQMGRQFEILNDRYPNDILYEIQKDKESIFSALRPYIVDDIIWEKMKHSHA